MPPDQKLPWVLRASDKQLAMVYWTALAVGFMALVAGVVALFYGLTAESIVGFVLAGMAYVVVFVTFLEDWERDMDWTREDR